MRILNFISTYMNLNYLRASALKSPHSAHEFQAQKGHAWCGVVVDFFQDPCQPYDFHMGPKREKELNDKNFFWYISIKSAAKWAAIPVRDLY